MKSCQVAVAGSEGPSGAIVAAVLDRRRHFADAYGIDVHVTTPSGAASIIADDAALGLDARSDRLGRVPGDVKLLLSTGPDVFVEAGCDAGDDGVRGFSSILHAIGKGCDVVAMSSTSLARDSRALRDLALRRGRLLKVNAATAGAMPSVDMLQHQLAECHVVAVEGIFSSEPGRLLDSMMQFGLTLDEAFDRRSETIDAADLHDQANGMATARALLLVANFGLGANLGMEDLHVAGLSGVTPQVLDRWRAQNASARLVGSLVRAGDDLTGIVEVRPYFPGDQMSLVRGRCKAISFVTAEMGDVVVTSCSTEPDGMRAAAMRDLEHIIRFRAPERSRGSRQR